MYYVKAKKSQSIINHHVFTCVIEDEDMNNQIISIIDAQGDRQHFSTNVKAQMTEWKMSDKPGFNKLAFIFKEIVKEISYKDHNRDYTISVSDIWGMKYESNNYAKVHDHWPALWSFSYYINPPKDGPKIIFPDTIVDNKVYELQPEHGMMVIFPAYTKHLVEEKEFSGYRYTVSGNGY